MANWNVLKAAVANIINANGNQEITGQLLQNVLNNIITNVGENATFAGIATLDTNPGAPDGPVFYLATTAGVYPNFNGLEVLDGEAIIFLWNNSAWTKKATGLATQEKLSQLGSEMSYHINNNDVIVSKLLNGYSKIIDISYFIYNGYFDTTGTYQASSSYKATTFIKVDSFSKIVLIGGGSTNISYIVFYDENKAILYNIVPSSSYYTNIVNIPSGCTYVRFCMHNTYFENGNFNLISFCYGDVIGNNVNGAVSKLSGFATFGKEIKNTQYAVPSSYNYRFVAINNVSGFIDKLYFCGTITEEYGSSIIRKLTFYILHVENNEATLKDSFDVMIQGGKNNYYNGLDFLYNKPLAVNDILAFKHEVHSVCYDNSTDGSISYIIGNNAISLLPYAIGLSYNIVPSMCDAKYGIQKAKNQIDNTETYIKKSFVYNTGAKDADIIKIGSSYTATLVEGDTARTVYAMYIDEEQLNISLKPLTDYFDIRFGKRATLAGTYVGIKKDVNGSYISVYRHANTSDLSAAGLVLAYQETLSFELLKDITYNITMQKERGTNSTITIIINSSDGRMWTKKIPCIVTSDNLQGLFIDGIGSMWGNIAIFDVVGSVKFSNLQYRLPYKKNCQMVICGHSFVEGNSVSDKKQDRFVSLIQKQVGREDCCVLGYGGSGISLITTNEVQIKALVNIFNYRPKYIVEVYGTNDSSMPYNTFISHLENFISFCKTNGIVPVLTTIPPKVNSSVPLFAQVNEWIRNSGYKYADIEKCFVDASGSPIVGNYLSDGVHPTIETHLSIYHQILHDVPELFDFL